MAWQSAWGAARNPEQPIYIALISTMSTPYAIAVLVCTVPAIVAELVALVFPRAMLGLLQQDPARVVNLPLTRVLAILSLFYMVNLGLLVFSDNQVFRISVVLLLSMSLLLWGTRKLIVRFPALVRLESTVCLVLLVNVLLSVLRTLGVLNPL